MSRFGIPFRVPLLEERIKECLFPRTRAATPSSWRGATAVRFTSSAKTSQSRSQAAIPAALLPSSKGAPRPLHGPPLHLHRDQDEWWYVVEGEYLFEVDGQEIHASAGATVFAPRGSRHTFQNIGIAAGHTITTVVPGGLDLFFEEVETAVPRGGVPDLAKMLPIFEKYKLELLGPPLAARPAATASAAD